MNKVYIFYFSSFLCPKFNSVKELFLFHQEKAKAVSLDYFFILNLNLVELLMEVN